MIALAPTVFALVLFCVSLALASERAEKPPLRSAPPSRVAAPHESSEKTRVVAPEKSHDASTAKVNVNTADVKSLMTLTGVGRKVAEKIVEYRDSHGPFKKAEEIRKVEGVGNGVWERNRDRIVVK